MSLRKLPNAALPYPSGADRGEEHFTVSLYSHVSTEEFRGVPTARLCGAVSFSLPGCGVTPTCEPGLCVRVTVGLDDAENALFAGIINNRLAPIVLGVLRCAGGGMLSSGLLRFPEHRKSVCEHWESSWKGVGLNYVNLEKKISETRC